MRASIKILRKMFKSKKKRKQKHNYDLAPPEELYLSSARNHQSDILCAVALCKKVWEIQGYKLRFYLAQIFLQSFRNLRQFFASRSFYANSRPASTGVIFFRLLSRARFFFAALSCWALRGKFAHFSYFPVRRFRYEFTCKVIAAIMGLSFSAVVFCPMNFF